MGLTHYRIPLSTLLWIHFHWRLLVSIFVLHSDLRYSVNSIIIKVPVFWVGDSQLCAPCQILLTLVFVGSTHDLVGLEESV